MVTLLGRALCPVLSLLQIMSYRCILNVYYFFNSRSIPLPFSTPHSEAFVTIRFVSEREEK